MQGELAALADARPRNLYLFGLFVADHQLPEPEALPAAEAPAAVPEPPEPAAVAAVPSAVHLPASKLTGSLSAQPGSTDAMMLSALHEQSAAASVAVPPQQHASACPSLPPPPPLLPASAADGAGAAMAPLTALPLDVSTAAAVAQEPGSAQQAGGSVAELSATQLGPEVALPGPVALPNVPPPPPKRLPRDGQGAMPAAAVEHVELAAAADPARKASRWSGSDRGTPECGTVSASPQQTQASPTDRQMTRWGKEPTRWGKELPSPLKTENNWKGCLVNNAAPEDTVFSVRPAQHGKLTSPESAPAPSPVAQQMPAEPTAGTPAQRAEVKLEAAAPSGDAAAAPEGALHIPASAVGAEDVPRQAASGTAPEESQRSSDWEAALVSGKAPWRSAADAAATKAEAATDGAPPDTASADGAKQTSKKHRRRSDPGRDSRKSCSRDDLRTRRSHDRRTDESGQQPGEQRRNASRGRRSSERCADRPSDHRQPTEGRREDRKRPRSRSRSAERPKGRRGRESSTDRLERDLGRWGDSRDRHVRGCGRTDPIGRRRGADRWGPITAFRSDLHGPMSKDQAAALPPPPASMAPAASMASMLILTTEPEERARLLASVLGQVQQSGKQSPAPHAAAISEEGDDCELPPLPDSPLLLQGLPAPAEGAQVAASAPQSVATLAAEVASSVQDVGGQADAVGTCMPAAEDAGAEPPSPLGAVTAATREQPDVPAAGDHAVLISSGSPHAPVVHAGPAQNGEAAIHGLPNDADGMHQPAKSDRATRRRRWDAVESAGSHNDGGQTKRQREGALAAEGSPSAQQQHSEAYQAACPLLEQGYNPLRTQAGLGPARQSYKTEMCAMGDKCPWQHDCDGAHVESELLSREQVTALCDLAREWRRLGVPVEWRHLVRRPGYDPFSRQSQSPAPQPASEEPRPPSESPPPLPFESACDGMPSPEYRLPPPSGDYAAWCAVKEEPTLRSYNPYGSPSPRSSTEGDEQPRNSLGIPYGGEASPPVELPPPPPPPPSGLPSHQQDQPLHCPASLDDSRERPGSSPRSAVQVPLASQRDSPLDCPSPGRLPQHGNHVRPPAQPDSLPCSPGLPSAVQQVGKTPPPLPPPPELRDMPPLGSAQKAPQEAAGSPVQAQAEPTAGTAQRGESAAAPSAGSYPATERARAILARGINPLERHRHPDEFFVRSLRTKLCQEGAACPRQHTICGYAHKPGDLLTHSENMALREVAHEWVAHGVPSEWKHVVKGPAAAHEDRPAARTVVVAQRRSKGVNPAAPSRRGKDVTPMSPQAGRLPSKPQSEQLPRSMVNEDVSVEDCLVKLIMVRTP